MLMMCGREGKKYVMPSKRSRSAATKKVDQPRTEKKKYTTNKKSQWSQTLNFPDQRKKRVCEIKNSISNGPRNQEGEGEGRPPSMYSLLRSSRAS